MTQRYNETVTKAMNFLTSFSQTGEIEFRFEDLQFDDKYFSLDLPDTKINDKKFLISPFWKKFACEA